MKTVRWGEFQVTGSYVDGAMTPRKVVPLADLGEPPPYDDLRDFASPCPVPEGGWRVLDPALAMQEALDQTMRVAAHLDGYAETWVDQSINPLDGQDGEDAEMGMNDPQKLVLNIRVTGDVAAAEATLRESWGGALCVSKARYTDAELGRIQDTLSHVPGMLMVGRGDDRVDLDVVYDDGTLQDSLDEQYGAGTVRVRSALVPVEGGRS